MNDNSRYPHFSKLNGPDLQALVQAYGGYHRITAKVYPLNDRNGCALHHDESNREPH